jgi:hypothetical protein
MKKRYKRGILLSTLTTASLLVAGTGFAALVGPHPDVALLKWADGIEGPATVAVGQNDAYSPRATCGACHDEVVDDTTTDDARIDGVAQGSYHGGGATKTVVKTQGQENANEAHELEWVSYNTKTYKHGFVESRHAQEGRNEDFGHAMRQSFGAKYTENGSGMFGKY